MKAVLQLLTSAETKLAKELTEQMDVEVVDLTRKDVDYREVLEKVFSADSVQVW
jgi:hypothetical protein